MYYPGQVVWDLDAKEVVQCGTDGWQSHPRPNTTPFIEPVEDKKWGGTKVVRPEGSEDFHYFFNIALPESIEQARALLALNRIQPMPSLRRR